MEADYVGSGSYPLKFVRYYNSLGGTADSSAGLGRNWTHSYSRRLRYEASSTVTLVGAVREDGKMIAFNLANGVYVGNPNFNEKLIRTANGWTLLNVEDETETYDGRGRLLSITNRAGLAQILAYDSAGRLVSVTDPYGRGLSFAYDSTNRMQSMAVPGGTAYRYAYSTNAFNNLVRVTYLDTTSRSYHYENASFRNHLSGITDENGSRFATYAYDTLGLAASTEHAGGAEKVTFVNSTSSTVRNVTVTRHVDSAQSAGRTYSFGSVVGVAVNTAIQGPPCPTCGAAASTYDAQGNLASRTDWNGNRTNYTYDLARNLETSRTEGLTSAGGTTAQTRTITTAWHASFRLPTGIAEPLRITANVYDPDGRQCGARGALCSRTIQATGDGSGALGFAATPSGTPRTWTYTYNANGSVLSVDGPRTDVADSTVYTYYANDDPDVSKRGHVASIGDAAGHIISVIAYNAHGQPLTIVDPNGLTTTLTYDARQRLISRTVGSEATTYGYDLAGQLIKVTLPDGSFLSYSYDAAHRLTGVEDNLGNRIAYTLDAMGNRIKEEVFDALNQRAQTRSRVFSSLNRLFRELGAQSQTTEYAYDKQGNVVSVKDPLNRITSNQYDALNRLREITDPALGVTQYAYNGLDALTEVTDPRKLVTSYNIDGLGNLTIQASPDTGTAINSYDSAGNLLTQTDAKGQTTSYAYDALNRVTRIAFHDGSKQLYAYDQGANGRGRLFSITETDTANQVTSVIAYAYDQHGRVTSETRTVAGVQYALSYSYDSFGRLSGLTYSSGRTVAYGFDSLGRVNQVTTTKGDETQTVVQGVQYHPFGGVKGYTLGNGQVYTRGIDLDGRISSYTLGGRSFAIGYDAASRISFINDIGNPANSHTYGYDSLDRLTQAVTPGTPYAYDYDAVGNRLSRTAGSSTHNYTYDNTSNRIASITPSSGPVRNFVFDANGSTIADGVNTYAYDARGRMAQAVSSLGSTTYHVNALGQRTRKSNSLGDTVFHYDTRGRLIAETGASGTLKRELIYLGDIPVGVLQ